MSNTTTTLKPMLSIGALGDQVLKLQTKLSELGHYTGKLDGLFGPITKAAVLAAQKLVGAVEDGIIGPESAKKLGLDFEFELPKLDRMSFKQLVASDSWSLAKQDQTYESLTCVGYQPEIDLLVAVVELRKPNGYGGGACGGGTREYVRFFVDWANDGNWRDVGLTDFIATDGPFTETRRFAVGVPLGATRPSCDAPHYPRIRAILSWDDAPEDAEDTPHWGNVVDVRVQIAPRAAMFKLSPAVIEALEQLEYLKELKIPKPQPLSLGELSQLYAAPKQASLVPPSRYAASALKKLSKASTAQISKLAPEFEAITGVPVKVSLGELAKFAVDGNQSYEELCCIGYDHANRRLTGVIEVKQPQGYSGNPCSAGSLEYVGFWLRSGSTWVHLGTATTRVYDSAALPEGGLRYAVALPVNLRNYQKPCSAGPVTLKIRAILSWSDDPTDDGPNHVPVWGNREETLIQLPALEATSGPGMFISTVGGVGVCDIDSNGYYDHANQAAYNAPFDGTITICGYHSDPPTSTSAAKPRYRISVRHEDDPAGYWEVLGGTFGVSLDTYSNSGNSQSSMTQVAVDGWFTYQEVVGIGGGVSVQVRGDVLGYWRPSKEGRHEVKLETEGPSGNPVPSLTTTCSNGSTRTVIPIMVDKIGPEVALKITHAVRGTEIVPVGDCGKFRPGDILHGTYTATDAYFLSCSFTLRPVALTDLPANTLTVTGVTQFDAITNPVGTGTGQVNGSWTLETGDLKACGYTLTLTAADRTLVDSSGYHHYNEKSVGFCLTTPEK
jgi:hypothetical protein